MWDVPYKKGMVMLDKMKAFMDMQRKMQEVNVIWIDFLKYISAKRKHSYTMRLNKRWRKIVYAMVYSGHFYPKYKGIHGKK